MSLTRRQKELVNIFKKEESIALRDIICSLDNPPSPTTIKDDLFYLKQLGIIDLQGRGRSALWSIRKKRNKPE